MNFVVNYFDFIRKLIPWFLRQTKTLALVQSFSKPLQDINDDMVEFRDDIAFKLAFNAQIIYLEKYLNTVYPNAFTYPNNIHILDGANVVFDYYFNDIENQDPKYLFNYGETFNPIYFENQSEQTSGVYSYIIRIPTSVQSGNDVDGVAYNETVVKKRVNFYNNAGKTYDIQYF